MAGQRFEAKKVGDQYVLVPKGEQADFNRLLYGASGGLMLLMGLKRGGLLGMLTTVAGGTILYQSMTGCSAMQRLMGTSRGGKRGDPRQAPSHQHDWNREIASQMPADEVDEASMESFPASDPPGIVRTQSTRDAS